MKTIKEESRRDFMKKSVLAGAGLVLASNTVLASNEETTNKELNLTTKWDKIFPKNNKIDHKKVIFKNRYGITLVGDLYIPKNINNKSLPALAISGPYGAVKEQSSGLYAQTMAEKGFITLAFDPSYTGESGGRTKKCIIS